MLNIRGSDAKVLFEVPEFVSPTLTTKGKVSLRFNIHFYVSRVSEMMVNARVKADKLSLLYLIASAEVSCVRFTQLIIELQ